MMMRTVHFVFLVILSLAAKPLLAQNEVIYKAKAIYIGDTLMQKYEAMVVRGEIIVKTGAFADLRKEYPTAGVVNYGKQYIYPGFIDAHCHFLAYAYGLKECNLVGTKSANEVVKRLQKFAKTTNRSWLIGRGWDQNLWSEKSFPDIALLDAAFPNTPVCLKRIDGHAVWINTAAAKAMNLNTEKPVEGGEIIKNNGVFTGVLVDNAADMVHAFIPELDEATRTEAIQTAAKNCYAAGITTLDEAGLEVKDIDFIRSLQNSGKLDMRIYAMLSFSEKNMAYIAEKGIQKTPKLTIRSVKFYLDGALGSRGALMKQDYCDRPGHKGLLLTKQADLAVYSQFLYTQGFQVCVHAIGDSANKLALTTFSSILPPDADYRWRIEHAQIMDPRDYGFLKAGNIIPSIQPTHATSDAPWAPGRICDSRLAGAYAYENLRKRAGIVALGTDFPVEDISPIKTFYSAVTRMDAGGILKEPFIPTQALSRENTLLGMTYWAAYANFEDTDKGTIEAGKLADFVVLSADIMTVDAKKIPKTKIAATYIGGKRVFKK